MTELQINCNGGKGTTETALRKMQSFGCGNFSVVGPVKGKRRAFGYPHPDIAKEVLEAVETLELLRKPSN